VVPALIEGVIPIPPVLSLRSRGALERLYTSEHLSAREISRLVGSSRSAVLDALDRFGIPPNEGGGKRTGTLPLGFDYLNHQLVKNGAEQAAIRMMRLYRAGGLPLQNRLYQVNTSPFPRSAVVVSYLSEDRLRPTPCRRASTSLLGAHS
jgi:hypothetical protein